MTVSILFSKESCNQSFKNYYHLMSDCLRPLYNYIGVNNLTEADVIIYFREAPTEFAKEKVKDLGFNIKSINEIPENYIEISKFTHTDIRYLIKKFNLFIKPLQNKKKIILIKRNNRRILINHNELLYSLKERFKDNYMIEEADFDNKTLKEQINMMYDCKILIGPHGAGFTNMFFLNELTQIIEFFPESFYVDCFNKLAIIKNIKYYHLHGKDILPPPMSLEDFVKLVSEGKIWGKPQSYVKKLRDIKGFSINITDVLNLISTIV